MREVESDLRQRVLELRMRAADLKLMLMDTANLANDPQYFYEDGEFVEEDAAECVEREAIVGTLRECAEDIAGAVDELVNLTRIGGPLAIKRSEEVARGD